MNLEILVSKFGGGVVYNAPTIKLFGKRVNEYPSNTNLFVVLSAFGKTTNDLEDLVDAFFKYSDSDGISGMLERIKDVHINIAKELFSVDSSTLSYVIEKIENIVNYIEEFGWTFRGHFRYDLFYDQIVPCGEELSSLIASLYLREIGIENVLMNTCDLIKTNSFFRKAEVNMEETNRCVTKEVLPIFFNRKNTILSQGFMGSFDGIHRFKTTLGREGSDYSAAIFAWALKAREVHLWKNVPGIMDKDPYVPGGEDAKPIGDLSYKRCRELLHGTARGVIHPETINLLESARIPLRVLSFENPELPGTLIS